MNPYLVKTMGEAEEKTGFFHGIENGYYDLLDSLDSKGIPVYAIIDPIDRIVPSMWIWILLIIGLLAFAFVGIQEKPVSNSLQFLDSDNEPLNRVSVELKSSIQNFSLVSDADGKVFFEYPTGTVFSLKASKTGYNLFQKTFVVGKEGLREKIRLESVNEKKVFSIQFVGKDNQLIVGKQIAFSINCSNGLVKPKKTDFLVESEKAVEVPQPEGCGALIVTVNSPPEYNNGPYPVSVSNPMVQLQASSQETEILKGKLIVFLAAEKPSELENSQPRVVLFRENRFEAEAPALGGIARLGELLPGIYSLLVYDDAQRFGTIRKNSVLIETGKEATENVSLVFNALFSLKAQVLNETSESQIENALVRLVDSDSGEVKGQARSDALGFALFSFSGSFPEGSLSFAVSVPGFFATTVPLEGLSETQIIRLKPVSVGENGKVEATVLNGLNEPIANARVFLLEAETKIVRQDISFQATDSKGTVFFSGIPSGNWIAFAEKGFDAGESDSFESKTEKTSRVKIVIEGKPAILWVQAFNESGLPASNAAVSVFAANGNSFESIESFSLDEEGTGSVSLKANQRVFVEISKSGFLVYRSEFVQLFSGQTSEINAELKKDDGRNEIRLESTGFVDSSNESVSRFEPGEMYFANFDLTVPRGGTAQYQKAGVLVRIGEEKGKTGIVFLESAQAANATAVIGKNWNPVNGEELDLAPENMATEKGSWARIVWENPSSGVYRVRVGFSTTKEAKPGTALLVHYNAWATRTVSEQLETDPMDAEVLAGAKQLLYAESNSKKIVLSSPADECTETVCFSNAQVRDVSTQQLLESPFQLLNGREYEVSLQLANNSGSELSNISFSMANKQQEKVVGLIQIEEFSLVPEEGEPIQQTVDGFETKPVFFGLGIGKSALLQIKLKMVADQWSNIVLSLDPSSGEKIEKSIEFESAGNQQFKAMVSPEEIKPQQETKLLVSVREKETSQIVSDATVSIQLDSLDGGKTEWAEVTDSGGQARFVVPGTSAGSIVTIQIQKDGFETVELQKLVGFLLECTPSDFNTTFGLGGKTTDSFSLMVFNNSPFELETKKPSLNASMAGVLNKSALDAVFESMAGTRIESLSSKEFVVEIEADPSFYPETEQDFSASLLLPFVEKQSQLEFLCQPSTAITIHASPQTPVVQAQSCVHIDPTDWRSSLEHNKAELKEPPLKISNDCVNSEGQAIRFDSMQAKIVWQNESIGNVDVLLNSDALSEQPKPQTLKPNEWVTIATPFLEGLEYQGILTFTPKEGALGKTASFEIIFAGKRRSNQRTESIPLGSTILVANIRDCLVFQPKPQEGIEMEINGEASFSVDSSLCGDLVLKAVLCQNLDGTPDEGCGGGASRGKLVVPTNPIELKIGQPAEISVKPKANDKLPGMYGIGIGVQTPESGNAVIPITTMKATVHKDPDKHFALNKFEFYLKNGKDAATLTNSYLSKRVSVQARASDWAKIPAPAEGGTDGTQAAGTGLDPQKIENLEEPLQQAQNQAQIMAAQAADSLDNARNLMDQALGQTNNAAQQTDQAKQGADQAMGMGSQVLNSAANFSAECPADTKGFCAGICVLAGGIEKLLSKAADGLGKALSNLLKAKGSMGTVISGYPGETGLPPGSYTMPEPLKPSNAIFLAEAWLQGSAIGSAQQGQTQGNQGRENAAVEETKDTSQGAMNASQQLKDSCLSSQLASQLDRKAQQESGQAGNNFSMAHVNLGMSGTQISALLVSAKACPWAAELLPKYAILKGAASGLDATTLATNQQTDTAKGGQQQAELASTGASTAACLASEKLREFANATETVSNDIGNDQNTVQQDLATLGPGQGLIDGMNNGIYKEDELVTNSIGGFLINLVNDAKNIRIVDSVPIVGRFNVQEARVLGHYQQQEVGIEFEKQPDFDSAEKPAYATVEVHAITREYPDPLVVPEGKQDWGVYQLESLVTDREQDYFEEFHLKFNPSEKTEIGEPKETTATSCVFGAFGETGETALPRINLSWEWKDIPINACEPSNPNYFYCDATQFSIMVSKRVRALENFVAANPNLPCPENVYQTQLDAEMQPFNQYLPSVGGGTYRASDFVPHCWLPESTKLFEGKPSLYWHVKDDLNKGGSIQWTPEIRKLEDLETMTKFNAYLIQDGYSADFFKDFAEFYTNINFADTPSFFHLDSGGRNYNQYFLGSEEGFLEIKNRFSDSKQLPTSGLYQVELNVEFGRDPTIQDWQKDEKLFDGQWALFGADGKPDGKISVQVLAKQQAESSNPLYYIPFDGAVGLENSQLKRDGYGVQFQVSQNDVFSISRKTKTRTLPSQSAKAVQTLSIDRKTSLAELNSRSGERGMIFSVESLSNTKKAVRFTPSLATPVLLKIEQGQASAEPFSKFFSLRQGDAFENTGENSNYWSGIGENCKDFEGNLVKKQWNENPDRKATQEDQIAVENWENAYALDWKQASKTGSVFLKTVFFVPPERKFTLQAESEGMEWSTPEQATAKAVDLKGILGMEFNRSGETESDKVTALDDLFELVKQEAVCISNSGSKTMYWWNPNALYQQTGQSGESIQSLETKAESNCIK